MIVSVKRFDYVTQLTKNAGQEMANQTAGRKMWTIHVKSKHCLILM